jgi:hypothetical protein
MTQDILVSQTSAAMFARNTPEARKKYGFPEPDDVMNDGKAHNKYIRAFSGEP